VLAAVFDALSVPPEPMGKGGRAPLTNNRLDLEDILGSLVRPDVEIRVVRKWHADQIADRVLQFLRDLGSAFATSILTDLLAGISVRRQSQPHVRRWSCLGM
jgi:hypothetical protein